MNTLTKNFVKRGLSLFLTVLLVFSLFTVGITSASAADVDVAPTGADTMTIYFQNNWQWTDVNIYYWGSSGTNPAWPGNSMDVYEDDKVFENGTFDVYKYEVPTDITGMIFNGIKNDGSGARDQSPDIEGSDIKTGVCYYMTWDNGNSFGTFEYNDVTLTTATATVSGATEAVVGTPISVTYTHDLSGATDTPTVTLVNSDDSDADVPYEVADGEITITPTEAGEYTFKVKVTYDDLSVTSNEITFTLFEALSASLAVSSTEGYVGTSFELTVTDNAEAQGHGTPSYTLLENGNEVTVDWNGNKVTVTPTEAGTYVYSVKVATSGSRPQTITTNTVEVQVNEFTDFGFTAKYPTSVQAGVSIAVTASLKEAVPYPVTFVLTNVENPTDVLYSTSESGGKFTIPTKTTDIGKPKSYTLTAYATVEGKEVYSTTSININVEVTEITETRNVTIYFKSTDTLGYAPIATVVGMKESKTDFRMEKAAYIVGNASGTAQYWWYSISVEVSSLTPRISFNVVSDRYAMEHTIEFDAVNSEYWFAVDNLNTNQTTDKEGNVYNYSLIDVSDWSEAKRNWTQSAAHMLWDDDVDGLWVEDSTNSDKDAAEVASYKAVFLGDSNGDGVVNIKDVTYIQKTLSGIENADSVSRVVSDVDGDNTVTIKDATAIQKKLVACL